MVQRLCLLAVFILLLGGCSKKQPVYSNIPQVATKHDLAHFFPHTVAALQKRINQTLATADTSIQTLVSYTPAQRTFENTVRAFDSIRGEIAVAAEICRAVMRLYPDTEMRKIASQGYVRIQSYSVQNVINNRTLYRALRAYADDAGLTEKLTDEQRYFLSEALKEFERKGLGLPDSKLELVKKLQNEIAKLSVAFDTAITTSTKVVTCTKEELAGVDPKLLSALHRDEAGHYRVPARKPIVRAILARGTVAKTRERVWLAFVTRGCPDNEKNLAQLIAVRDNLAQTLGFPSFAHLSLDNQMARVPGRVSCFLSQVGARAQKKLAAEMTEFKKNLPPGVVLDPQGRIQLWDLHYVLNHYKKTALEVDGKKIAEYFPLPKVLENIFALFKTFLGLTFRPEQLPWSWHPEVQCWGVYNEEAQVVGYLLFDLHPRAGKFSNSCLLRPLSALKTVTGVRRVPVMIVVSNFPRAIEGAPVLLSLNDLETLLHELGHAVHTILGATDLYSFSGTSTTRDFSEAPSQLFKEWGFEKEVIKLISCHYKTGAQLSDELVAKLAALRNFDSGLKFAKQVGNARYALDCFGMGAFKDLAQLRQLFTKALVEAIVPDPRVRYECAFTHLTTFDARYYGYLWSLVCTSNIKQVLKQRGLLKRETGRWLEKNILSKGGSMAPEKIFYNAMGHDVSLNTFFTEFDL